LDISAFLEILFELVGGLGVFLLGMKYMSEGMQAVAGANLRKMISAVTTNRFMATGVGAFVTCVVQSSSITTVLVVGSVNSGVMTLSQAIGVIMGANIGTTITGWILVLKIGKYGLPLLGLMALIYLFVKGDRVRFWALSLMGVGMIFFGLEIMKDACGGIKDLPDFEAWFKVFQATSYLGVLKCVLVGCVMTMLVQSSSATLGITISLATQGVISYETAAALILGENLGTTVTAYLASLGATVNARRASYFHMIFNLLGVCWIVSIFFWYTDFVLFACNMFWGTDVTASTVEAGDTIYPHMTAAIAATHSIFNIANTILFLPLVSVFVRFLERLVPSKQFKEKPHLTDLDIRMLETPILAIEQSRNEILKMADGCHKMLGWLRQLLSSEDFDTALVERLERREQVLDNIQDEIAIYITNLLAGNVSHAIAAEARHQIRISDEYESLSDYVYSIMKFDRRLRKAELRFMPHQIEQLLALHDLVDEYVTAINTAFEQQNRDSSAALDLLSKGIRKKIKQLRNEHLIELSAHTMAPQVSVAYMAALNSYVRVRDHSNNIAEVIAGEK
jgi:phosphate:Na+ symporter